MDLVEARAALTPHAPAVEWAGHALDYRRVTRAANALARDLHDLGVGSGDLVPLVARNGPALPVAMLGVLAAGAAFLPLDARWPAPRLRDMVRACSPRVVLSIAAPGETRAHPTTWSADAGGPATLVVDVERLGTADTHRGGARPAPEDLAYGFYTSGSTGVPKCALNVHRGLLNRFLYMTRRFVDGSPHRVLQNSRHTFDSSLWQLLWPLTHGGTVVIPEPGHMLDLTSTVRVIARHRVTMTDFVPTIFNGLVELLDSDPQLIAPLTCLRRLLIGGEEINARAVRRFRAMLPGVEIVNTYGPTEAAIGSVFHDVSEDERIPLPIGRPIDNTWAVVLDDLARPVEPGEIGEIHIGGACLGTGYLDDAARTEAAFVDNPFPELPGPRMYRTGDLGHHDPDGVLFFDGRRDQQFKIGGVRVESAEVEHAIAAHPCVREVKVIAHEHGGATYLAAFVTVAGDTSSAELTRHARAALPAELVPKRFLVLDRMPVNGNGKADRGALARLLTRPPTGLGYEPDPAGSRGAPAPGRELPALLELWARVLPEPVTRTDRDFFDSGGDSLSAQRLALAVSARFHTNFSVRDVVAAPTVAAQLARLGTSTLLAAPKSAAGHADASGGHVGVRDHVGADLALDPDIRVPRPSGEPPHVRHVLITGVTGFVGAHVLREVLRLPDVSAYCLVRAPDAQAARRRVEATLRHYRLWRPEYARRVTAVAGDLSAPGLGLTPAHTAHLAERVDTIVHAGALVNLVRGYAAHRPANVLGTVEVLRFATLGRPKALHFVSTLAARAETPDSPKGVAQVPEAPWPAATAATTGYGRSKWVGEHLVLQAAQRGLPVAVHRLGEVMPATDTGVPNLGSRTDLLIRACLRVGARPADVDLSLDYTPVDAVGTLVTAAVARHERGWFHLLHPRAVRLDALLGEFGAAFALRPVGYATFHKMLADTVRGDPEDRTLAGALALLPAPDVAAGHPNGHESARGGGLDEVFHDGTSRFSITRAEDLARRIGWHPPTIDAAVLGRYIRYHRTSAHGRGKGR
ncbi:non-ribosomal peptide synthetase [Streptomyces sp. SID3343]|uniref:amino acid adenylation domain-containing protein n=1 Tax=Streptomyces sp. SID3343 TaxID=2690260 RepID=UPI00136A6669